MSLTHIVELCTLVVTSLSTLILGVIIFRKKIYAQLSRDNLVLGFVDLNFAIAFTRRLNDDGLRYKLMTSRNQIRQAKVIENEVLVYVDDDSESLLAECDLVFIKGSQKSVGKFQFIPYVENNGSIEIEDNTWNAIKSLMSCGIAQSIRV